MGEARRAAGTLRKLWKNVCLGVEVKMMIYERAVVPMALCGTETWGLREAEKRKLDDFVMVCLRSTVCVD